MGFYTIGFNGRGLIVISDSWFIFIIICLAVYILAIIFFRPKPPPSRYETLTFLDRMRQTKELNIALYVILKDMFLDSGGGFNKFSSPILL